MALLHSILLLPALLSLLISQCAVQAAPAEDSYTFVPPPPSPYFRFDLSCNGAPSDYCLSVNSSLATAGAYLADAIQLTAPIRVNASVVDLCKMVGDCSNNNILAAASPLGPVSSKDSDGRSRIIPTALTRQSQSMASVPSGQYDILIYINYHDGAWFPGQGPIYGKQLDFSWTVLHELVHGLGMGSAWKYHADLSIKGITNTNLIYPKPTAMGSEPSGAFLYTGQTFTYEYDRYLMESSSGTMLDTKLPPIDAVIPANTLVPSQKAFVQAIQSNPAANNAATTARSLSQTPGAISFRLFDGSSVVLDTDPKLPGSALDHVGPDYKDGVDCLMYSKQSPGIAYANHIRQAGGKFPVGPLTLRLLQTLGYTLKSQTIELPPPFPSPASILRPLPTIWIMLGFLHTIMAYIHIQGA
ncbi:MAG: hypothetical protein DHS80DRAFT_28414 [Piptocephalis tieghemiana]|nr:MAG: hypothetical protein DHS80DRAFT_28414 [Piptocephalis tieghemiana]